MIRLSKLADYAFVLLTQMVSEDLPAWSAAELAEKTTLPLPTVAKIMKLLAKAKVVSAQRGSMGGYRLGKPSSEIFVAEIVEAVDGPIAITCCVGKIQKKCAAKSFCTLQPGWHTLNDAMRNAMMSVSLAELVLRSPVSGAEGMISAQERVAP